MKKLYALVLFFSCLTTLQANFVSEEKARIAAQYFLAHYSRLKSGFTELSPGFPENYHSVVTYYSFSISGGGWILISADNSATPVLAYSVSGEWDGNNLSPSAKAWLEIYNQQIYEAVISRKTDLASQAQWQELLDNQFNDAVKTVLPLVNTQWGQSMYYNDLCPASSYAPWGYGGHVPAGCVAITMAQIMKYHHYPEQGIGSNSYSLPTYGALTANFGNTGYNWNSMPLKAGAANASLATLIYHCGIAVKMAYNFDGSGAASEVVPYAMKTYFNYDNTIKLIKKEEVGSDEIWRSIIRTELDAGRPVYYAGSGNAGGHAFVCDGYDNSNPSKFHINWGWNGYGDGYFALNALTVASGSFNEFNKIIIGIKPRPNPGYICRIESPKDDAWMAGSTNLPVSLKTIKGTTTKAILFVDGVKTDSAETAPFGFSIRTSELSAGPHQILVKATDGINWDSHEAIFHITSSCWQRQKITLSIDSVEVRQIFPVDPSVTWAVLKDSSGNRFLRRLIRTTDGGATWTEAEITCPVCSNMEISNIYALSATKAYACLNPGNTTGGALVYTSDGGANWTVQTSADFTGSWANWVHFFDEKNGVCLGDAYRTSSFSGYNFAVYTTSNGGTTWNRVPASRLPAALPNETGTENFYDAVDSIIWFGTGNGRIFKSANRGFSWSVRDTVLQNVQTNVRFKDASHGIAFGGFGTTEFGFKKTDDGGDTWYDALPYGPLTGQDFEHVPGTDSVWINSGLQSSVSISDNHSYNWLDAGTAVHTTAFLSPTCGWAGSPYTLENGGGIYKWTGSFQPPVVSQTVVRVKNSLGVPVPDALVQMNDQVCVTNRDGLVTINIRSFGNPEHITVEKDGFASFSANCFIKDTIGIVLPSALSVSFQVKNKLEEAVNGATVLFNNQVRITDENGMATFGDIAGGTYPFAITKTKYFAGYGMLQSIHADTVLNIRLVNDLTTVIARRKSTRLVFPNPASYILNILSENTITRIDIISMEGKTVLSRSFVANIVQVPLSGIPAGEYVIKIFRGTSQDYQKLTIRR